MGVFCKQMINDTMGMNKITQGDGREQHGKIELSAMMFCISACQCNIHEPLLDIEHLKCLVQPRNQTF